VTDTGVRGAYRFGPFHLDVRERRLLRGCDVIPLRLKVFDTLRVLVEHAGRLVTKQELLDTVWPETTVEENNLNHNVSVLRKALGERATGQQYIETVPRVGYRFVAPVEAADTQARTARSQPLRRKPYQGDPVAPDEARPARILAGLAERAGRPTVAVLPFRNVSGDPDQEYFTQGITEDITTALAKHRSLLVIARSSAIAFNGPGIDARSAGVDLGASYVVEGSAARSGQRLRITVRLIDTEAGRHVWAERYDRDLEDVFDVRDRITAAIAGRIEPEVGTVERRRAERKSPQALQAWDFLHLGLNHLYNSTADNNQEAQRLLRRAIELDPILAEAYSWLSYAIVLSMIYFDVDPDEERLTEALSLAKKGVELDDQHALTHFTYGRALLASRAYADALAELETAAVLNPNLAVVYCGLADSLAYEGRIEEAIPLFDKAISLSPFDPQRWAFYAYRALAHVFAGQFESAVEWAQRATRVPHCHYWPFAHRVSALGHLQQVDALRAAKTELLQRKPGFTCAFARRRLFFVKNPAHVELYIEGLRKAGMRPDGQD
jgi:TolB-like protein